jgi:Putative ATP-dependent Lon protease
MVFVANINQSVDTLVKTSHLFAPFPDVMIDPAFFDRFHAYVPGWEIPTIPGELFAKFQTGFYADAGDAAFKALGVGWDHPEAPFRRIEAIGIIYSWSSRMSRKRPLLGGEAPSFLPGTRLGLRKDQLASRSTKVFQSSGCRSQTRHLRREETARSRSAIHSE